MENLPTSYRLHEDCSSTNCGTLTACGGLNLAHSQGDAGKTRAIEGADGDPSRPYGKPPCAGSLCRGTRRRKGPLAMTTSADIWAALVRTPCGHPNVPNVSFAGYRFGEMPLPGNHRQRPRDRRPHMPRWQGFRIPCLSGRLARGLGTAPAAVGAKAGNYSRNHFCANVKAGPGVFALTKSSCGQKIVMAPTALRLKPLGSVGRLLCGKGALVQRLRAIGDTEVSNGGGGAS
jgi:hypothetical protein